MPPPSPQAANFHSTRALVDRSAANVKPVDLNNTGNLFATVKTDNKNEQIIEVEVVAEDTKPLVQAAQTDNKIPSKAVPQKLLQKPEQPKPEQSIVDPNDIDFSQVPGFHFEKNDDKYRPATASNPG